MIIFKNCCFRYSLRAGCIIIGYFYVIQGYLNILVAFLVHENNCPALSRFWFLQSQIGIISGVILLAGCFNVRAKMCWVSVKCKNNINKKKYVSKRMWVHCFPYIFLWNCWAWLSSSYSTFWWRQMAICISDWRYIPLSRLRVSCSFHFVFFISFLCTICSTVTIYSELTALSYFQTTT